MDESGGFGGASWTFVFDRQGRVVWALATPYGFVTMHVRASQDGTRFLVDHNSFWWTFDADDGRVLRMAIDGVVEQTVLTPGLHHAFVDLADGSIAFGAIRGFYFNETLDVVDPAGALTSIFDCREFLDEIGDPGYPECGSNTIWWDPSTDHFLYSFYSLDTIVEVDRATGEAVRWFGNVAGSWRFDPPGSQFWWQHGGYFTAAGTLLTSSDDAPQATETIVREYALDPKTQTLTEIWNFGLGDGVFGEVMGEAHRLGNGNTLHNTGGEPRLREATVDGDVAWEVHWPQHRDLYRSVPLQDLYPFKP